jgi:excinuclease ABC subunit C
LNIIRQWLSQRRGNEKVEILVPNQGPQQELIQMAAENAAETLRALQAQWQADRHRQEQALAELQIAFKSNEPLNRIECYDISNIQGTSAVGSMVVFEQGIPKKGLYRRFNIRSVHGPDDFASMEEVLIRRFNRWKTSQEAAQTPGKRIDPAYYYLPDLLIVDGGKGQLGRAVAVLEEFELTGKFLVAGLAKQNEELFLPDESLPLVLARHSQALYMVQRIRDEAHRFAITSHRSQRTKQGLASRLDAIPGVGPVRRKALLVQFGSVERIMQASIEELCAVEGIHISLAQNIKDALE